MRMAKVTKEDCVTVDKAAEMLEYSRASLYTYLNLLDIQRYRFKLDRHTYILKSDVERIRKYIVESKGR
jgi:hypothetical protein